MKNLHFKWFAAFMIAGSIFWSCQEESFIPDPSADALLKSGNVEFDCTDCFAPGGPFLIDKYQENVHWGGPKNTRFSKTVQAEVYNTEEKLVIRIKSSHFMSDMKFHGYNEETSLKDFQGIWPAEKWFETSLNLPENWQVCDPFPFELVVTGNGPQAVLKIDYVLKGVCTDEITSVTDIDGNEYPVVKLAGQYWMAKNLAVTRYRNGEALLTNVSHFWYDLTEGGVASPSLPPHISYTIDDIVDVFGMLYNWYAIADERGICPTGWSPAGHNDWLQLKNFLIDNYPDVTENNITFKLRSTKYWYSMWEEKEFNGTDDFGFNAYPAGYIQSNGIPWGGGEFANWWTPGGETNELPMSWFIRATDGHFGMGSGSSHGYLTVGHSVRCIKR
jgi:uncharacterized protein (TIGR02145 family)